MTQCTDNMKILFLSQYYPPEVGAPQTRIRELVSAFRARDHEVTVLTAMPNYPVGKIYPGFGGVWSTKDEGGARVVRTWLYATQRADRVRRLTSYSSFVVMSGVVGTVTLPRVDFVLVESPPLFLGLTGLWLSRIKGAKFIFNVSDLWPESAVHVGAVQRGSMAFATAAKLEKFLYRQAWLVTGQSKTIVQDIVGRFPDVRTLLVSNGADTSCFRPDRSGEGTGVFKGPAGECRIVYAGLHGLAQGLDQVLRAATHLSSSIRCRFYFVGDGPEKAHLLSEAKRLKLQNVDFLDPIASEKVPILLASADIGLVPLKTSIPGAVPSKLYESMASGKPVVFVGGGEGADIVHRHHSGLVVRPGDEKGMAEAIETLARNPDMRAWMGRNGRAAAVRHYDRSEISRSFVEFLEGCIWGPTGA